MADEAVVGDFIPGGTPGDGNGQPSGGSTSGGSSAAPAEKGPTKEELKALRRGFLGLLKRYRINPGPFADLVDKAVRQEWPADFFISALAKSKEFSGKNGLFPGIKRLFKEGLSVTAAVAEYRQRAVALKDVPKTLGIREHVGKKQLAHLIKGNVSPDEFGARLLFRENMASNETLRANFNLIRQSQGLPAFEEMRWRNLMTNPDDRSLWDQYEAAQLLTSGLNLTPQEALGAARGLGQAGELIGDLSELVAQVKSFEGFRQELDQRGIRDADLLGLVTGADPKGIAPVIDRLAKQREAMGRGTERTAARRTPSGVPTIFGPASEGL